MPLIVSKRNKKKEAKDTAFRIQNPEAPLLPGMEGVKEKPVKKIEPQIWHCHIKIKEKGVKPGLNVEVTYVYIFGFTEELKLVLDAGLWYYDDVAKKFWVAESQIAKLAEIAKDYYEEVLGFRGGYITNLKTGDKWKEG